MEQITMEEFLFDLTDEQLIDFINDCLEEALDRGLITEEEIEIS